MKLTTKGRYAVTAMTDLAAHAGGAPVGLGDIAVRQGISLAYLEQIFARLRRAGLVVSARGVSGGYSLARSAKDISVADVIAAADEEIVTTACERDAKVSCQGGKTRCLTHDLWDELGRQIDLFFNAVTLEDVLERRVAGIAAVNAPARSARPVLETAR